LIVEHSCNVTRPLPAFDSLILVNLTIKAGYKDAIKNISLSW